MKSIVLFAAIALLFSCSTTSKQEVGIQPVNRTPFVLKQISSDPSYGFTEDNPVMVGGASENAGPSNERRYLDALAGPNGENLIYSRSKSCCARKSDNAIMGIALLDVYNVTWEGTEDTASIYINMYDSGPLMAPVGFTIK